MTGLMMFILENKKKSQSIRYQVFNARVLAKLSESLSNASFSSRNKNTKNGLNNVAEFSFFIYCVPVSYCNKYTKKTKKYTQ